MKRFLILISVFFIYSGCEKGNNLETSSVVEFYMLDSYSTRQNSFKILEDSIILNETALIKYEEIISYNPTTYEFKVTDEAIDSIIIGLAFAVTVDKEIIYTGYFWHGLSSGMVDWIVIVMMWPGGNILKVQIGYPGFIIGDTIPDKRNDPRILEVLRKDNKLIK